MAIDWRVTVQNLLNKAASTSELYPEESAALYEKAMYLMAKYGIEEAQLRTTNGKIEKAIHEVMLIGAPYTNQKANLLRVVASFLGGQTVGRQGDRGRKLWLFGFAEDIERIKMLYFSLLAQLHLELSVAEIPKGEHGRPFRESFHHAFVITVAQRFDAIQKKVAAEPGNSLVIYDREKQVKDILDDMFPDVRTKNPRMLSLSSSAGVSAGITAGQRADIGQTRLRQ